MSGFSEAANIPCPEVGMRAWYLTEAKTLEAELGFSTSDFVTVPWRVFDEALSATSESLDTATAVAMADGAQLTKREVHPAIVAHYAERIRPIISKIMSATTNLTGNVIISRSSPLDE